MSTTCAPKRYTASANGVLSLHRLDQLLDSPPSHEQLVPDIKTLPILVRTSFSAYPTRP